MKDNAQRIAAPGGRGVRSATKRAFKDSMLPGASAGRGRRINRSYNCVIEPARSHITSVPEPRVESESIAADIEAFKRAGGVIEVLP